VGSVGIAQPSSSVAQSPIGLLFAQMLSRRLKCGSGDLGLRVAREGAA